MSRLRRGESAQSWRDRSPRCRRRSNEAQTNNRKSRCCVHIRPRTPVALGFTGLEDLVRRPATMRAQKWLRRSRAMERNTNTHGPREKRRSSAMISAADKAAKESQPRPPVGRNRAHASSTSWMVCKAYNAGRTPRRNVVPVGSPSRGTAAHVRVDASTPSAAVLKATNGGQGARPNSQVTKVAKVLGSGREIRDQKPTLNATTSSSPKIIAGTARWGGSPSNRRQYRGRASLRVAINQTKSDWIIEEQEQQGIRAALERADRRQLYSPSKAPSGPRRRAVVTRSTRPSRWPSGRGDPEAKGPDQMVAARSNLPHGTGKSPAGGRGFRGRRKGVRCAKQKIK